MTAKWLFVTLIGSVFCSAQAPSDLFQQAPPPIENAIRERITEFYQAQSEGKFRLADKWVAEDSKDVYFEADKRRCAKFAVTKITYSDEFTKAVALVKCDTDIMMPPQGVVRVTMPIPSKWKVVDGQWMWYVIPTKGRESPFGQMAPGEGDAFVKLGKGPSVEELHKMFQADKTLVRFTKAGESTETVALTSEFPGELQLTLLAPPSKDLKVELDRKAIRAKESVALKITYLPGAPRMPGSTEEIRITAQPLNRTLVVQVAFGGK